MRRSSSSANGACSRSLHGCFSVYISPGRRSLQPYHSVSTSIHHQIRQFSTYSPPKHFPTSSILRQYSTILSTSSCATRLWSAIQFAGVCTTAIPWTHVNGLGSADIRRPRRPCLWATLAPTIHPGPRSTTRLIPNHPVEIGIGAILATRVAILLVSHLLG